MGNRPLRFSPGRKAGSLALQAWPIWLALLVATGVFALLRPPIASRRRVLHHAATVLPDSLWVERAVAAAAADRQAEPGSPIPQESWRPFLSHDAPPILRAQGLDAFGHPFGPQAADRPVALPAATRDVLGALAGKRPGGGGQ